MLGASGPVIRRLAAENRRETLGELKENGWDHDPAEVDLAFQEIRDMREFVLPRFVRGPFVVSLWACFESGVNAVAWKMHDELNALSKLNDRRERSFLERARHYFQEVLDLPLEPDHARYERLVDLCVVRNALAHANGLREGMTPKKWAQLEQALSRDKGELNEEPASTCVEIPSDA
jgi:hypothetical protein